MLRCHPFDLKRRPQWEQDTKDRTFLVCRTSKRDRNPQILFQGPVLNFHSFYLEHLCTVAGVGAGVGALLGAAVGAGVGAGVVSRPHQVLRAVGT